VTFSVPSGSAGTAVRFDNGTPTAIPDNSPTGVDIPITVLGISEPINKVTASFNITHTWDADLLILLTSPDNITVRLVDRRGGSGDNFGSSCSPDGNRTRIDDAGATPIGSGSAPFVGIFRPETPLSVFKGKTGTAVNGVWKLHVSDLEGLDVGTVNCWSLFISPATCADGGGSCVPLPITLASFTGRVVNGNQIQLNWTTISELNNYGFEVQKSAEPTANFRTIPGSFIPGHGTTNEPRHYSYVDRRVEVRTLYYRLKQIDLDGEVHYTDPIRIDVLTGVEENAVPTEFSLGQNYPNPFNPSTIIRYGLPVASEVKLEIFNTLGQRVAMLVNEKQEAGFHEAVFENQQLASGVYFYTLHAGQFKESKKLLLLR
jgi:subtilisin-like proprotein convertase family protein